MDDALLRGTVEELHRLRVGRHRLGPGGGTHLPERGPQGASVGTVLNGAGTTLTHTLGSGLDTGHGNLGNGEVRSGTLRKLSPKK